MSQEDLVSRIQHSLREQNFSGWLLYDFRGSNPLARSLLHLKERPAGSRRWFYFVPSEGNPVRLVHAIETGSLDTLPGQKVIYRSWRSLHESLQEILRGHQRVAMEYSPAANNPYVSRVDAGTVELVRSCGVEVQSSGDLIQEFEARLSELQWQQHLLADHVTTSAFERAWDFIGEKIREQGSVEEQAVCDVILQHFAEHEMTTYSPPTVARAPHNRLPHYETGTGEETAIRQRDLVLIDLWCKAEHQPAAIYSDLTRMAYVGADVPEEYARIFAIVARARDAGIEFVKECFAEQKCPQGWEVDHVVREVIEQAGYGEAFLHRTGHSLGAEVHGNGAHLDDLEMHEERRILPGSLFTIEPGIYLENFGIRSEVNLFVDSLGLVHVTGEPVQTSIHCIV